MLAPPAPMRLAKALLVVLLFGLFACAARAVDAPGDNQALSALYQHDQEDRNVPPGMMETLDWAAVSARDRARRTELESIFRQGGVHTANDHLRAAYLFQHGDTVEDYRLAYALAGIASALDPQNKEARWLMAAAWDWLMRKLGRPQWYGTQFDKPGPQAKGTVDPIDGRVTDEERKAFHVPPLSEIRQQAEKMNAGLQ